ncbi:MAG: aryl-alcohol dehydrogenase-like predicted oxidoreductase [Paraglaciecola sp.]|jgi:aryl-alcohol dehydrogenase-like predicted oxidoreductase
MQLQYKIISPILGTAMWGWTTPKAVAFELLDKFYERGFREVDGATNYPINKNASDWRAAEKILLEWITAHGVDDLKIMMKVGSLNNMKTPDHNLTKSFLLMNFEEYHSMFGNNLRTWMIHWDNRADKSAILETFEMLQIAVNQGFNVGFSGVKNPEIYADLNREFNFDFRIQIKHNLLHSDYEKYEAFHGKRRFITYGINAGGIKLDSQNYHQNSSLKARAADWNPPMPILQKAQEAINLANQNTARPSLSTFNELGMIYAFYHADIAGILLGTSRLEQLTGSLDFMQQMQEYDYSEIFEKLRK